MLKNDFENFAIIRAISMIFYKDFLKYESYSYHSINLPFDKEVAEKILKWSLRCVYFRVFTKFGILVFGLKFHWYLRTLNSKFQEATSKIEVLYLKSSNTNETLDHTPL